MKTIHQLLDDLTDEEVAAVLAYVGRMRRVGGVHFQAAGDPVTHSPYCDCDQCGPVEVGR